MYALLLDNYPINEIRSSWLVVFFKCSIGFWNFFLFVLSITSEGLLKSSATDVDLMISSFFPSVFTTYVSQHSSSGFKFYRMIWYAYIVQNELKFSMQACWKLYQIQFMYLPKSSWLWFLLNCNDELPWNSVHKRDMVASNVYGNITITTTQLITWG